MDVHTHGAMNEDFSDGKADGLQTMSRYYAKNGVTSFLATTLLDRELSSSGKPMSELIQQNDITENQVAFVLKSDRNRQDAL